MEPVTIVNYEHLMSVLDDMRDRGISSYMGCCCEPFFAKHPCKSAADAFSASEHSETELSRFQNLNKRLGKGKHKVHVVQIPVRRDQLIPYLVDGHADLAAANLTITEARRQHVDFSIPAWTGVDEIVVTGPEAPEISSLEDLDRKSVV